MNPSGEVWFQGPGWWCPGSRFRAPLLGHGCSIGVDVRQVANIATSHGGGAVNCKKWGGVSMSVCLESGEGDDYIGDPVFIEGLFHKPL